MIARLPLLPALVGLLMSGLTPRADQHPRAVALGDRGALEVGVGPAGRGPWRGFPISLSLRDAPLPEVLRSFAQLSGLNLVVDPRVQGTVTLELKNVPWDQALHVILKTHGLGAELDGRPWLVVTP
jgi:type II secretory pathway component HofQ